MKLDAQSIELYNAIEEAIKLCGSAEALIKSFYASKDKRFITCRKNKPGKKWLMRYLRIKSRMEKGLSVHRKGGALLIAAKTN